MAKFKEGERVRVKARTASEKEVLEGHYAPYLARTTGTILKIYDAKQIAVNLDIDSLPEEVRQRHAEQQEAMYRRWFDSLSEEARSRLTDEEKAFRLNYVVLLAESDLEPFSPPSGRRKASEPAPSKAMPAASNTTPAKPSQRKAASTASEKASRKGSGQKGASPADGTARKGAKPAEPPLAPDKTARKRAAFKAMSPKSEGASRKRSKQGAKVASSPPATPTRPTPEQLDLLEEAYLKARQRKTR